MLQNQRTIFRIKHGSTLYGTRTPTSDIDYKEVHLPAGREIILQRANDVIDHSPKNEFKQKNIANDVDLQSFSLHKLFAMITRGDIIGMEMIYANVNCIELIDPIYQNILDNKSIFLSKKIDGYVGYCQRQAAKYGIRGSRVAAVRKAVDFLQELMEDHGPSKKLGVFADAIEDFFTFEHSSLIDIPNRSTGVTIRHLEVCDRKAPYTISLKEAYNIYKRCFDEYGHRSLAAEKNEGIDWKAMSHAVRVGNQAIELLQTGVITFPRPEAEFLLRIKKGEIPYAVIGELLEQLLVKVEEKSKLSSLPDLPNYNAIEDLLVECYLKQVS